MNRTTASKVRDNRTYQPCIRNCLTCTRTCQVNLGDNLLSWPRLSRWYIPDKMLGSRHKYHRQGYGGFGNHRAFQHYNSHQLVKDTGGYN